VYEDRPEKDTPEHVLAELREYGGLSPDGQSIWRLVLAQNCRIHCFGTQNHISKGRVGKMGDLDHPVALVPDRIEEGEFWIPRYQFVGWILQRWFPASVWGSRSKWEGERAKDGRTRLLAAYPQSGDYMMMPCGPWKTIAEVGDLKGAIRAYNAQQRANPANWNNLAMALTSMEERDRQLCADAYADELEAQFREGFSGALRTVSVAAQQMRNTIADYSAGGVNLGASEKWGN
jgi:hypothetical protein